MKKLLNFIKKIFKKEKTPQASPLPKNMYVLSKMIETYNPKNKHLMELDELGDVMMDTPISMLLFIEGLKHNDFIKLGLILKQAEDDYPFKTTRDFLLHLEYEFRHFNPETTK